MKLKFKRWNVPAKLIENTVGAEIGVQYGHFAQTLVELKPAHLYLIDPWLTMPTRDKATNRPQQEHNEIFEQVTRRFIHRENISIIRKKSEEACDQFENNSLDWVYIDALHDYDSVKQDLHLWHKKIKNDGFIWGHDWRGPELKKKPHVKVKEAVLDFCAANNWKFVGHTCETRQDKTSNSYFITTYENFNKLTSILIK